MIGKKNGLQYHTYVVSKEASVIDSIAFAYGALFGREAGLPGSSGRNREEYRKSAVSVGTASGEEQEKIFGKESEVQEE